MGKSGRPGAARDASVISGREPAPMARHDDAPRDLLLGLLALQRGLIDPPQRPAACDPVSQARFLLEAKVTGRLEHPGIVPVYGLGRYADGRPYYAMRFIEGETLKEAIERFHSPAGSARQPGEREIAFRRLLRSLI